MAAKEEEAATFLAVPEETRPVTVASTQIKEATAQTTANPVKVKVNAPYRVVHEGKPFTDGDVVEVPPDTAHTWVAARCESVGPSTRTPSTKEKK